MDPYRRDLWGGGRWEQEEPNYPTPPPVVIPKAKSTALMDQVNVSRKSSLKLRIFLVGMLTLILGLGVTSIYLNYQRAKNAVDTPRYFFDFFFGDSPSDRDEDWDYEDLLTDLTEHPTIPSSPTGTGVTLDFERPGRVALTPQEIYEKNLPSVVYIRASNDTGYSTGTGVIMSEDGYIVTNAHVIEGSSSAYITLWDDRTFAASLVGYDFLSDLAVLSINATDLQPASFTDSDSLQVGDLSYALGNPYGQAYRSTFTDGMISGLNRIIEMNEIPLTYIQTTAAINSGNSGGALINDAGQVVGITTIKIMSQKDTIEAMGFTIPSKRVKQIVDRLIEGESVSPASVGIIVQQVNAELMVGLEVITIETDCDAYAQGMREGDIITVANGTPIRTVTDLNNVKSYLFAGDSITYEVLRDDVRITITAKLHETKQ
ncbi:MAG: trypsin-like peptidase domain-containing protein [Eubacteriales bacterium]